MSAVVGFAAVGELMPVGGERRRVVGSGILTRERHRLALVRAILALEAAQLEVNKGAARTEIAAEEIRSAIRALDSLVGRIGVDALLGEIFASFCIGK